MMPSDTPALHLSGFKVGVEVKVINCLFFVLFTTLKLPSAVWIGLEVLQDGEPLGRL